jgi:hypothetical protein
MRLHARTVRGVLLAAVLQDQLEMPLALMAA